MVMQVTVGIEESQMATTVLVRQQFHTDRVHLTLAVILTMLMQNITPTTIPSPCMYPVGSIRGTGVKDGAPCPYTDE